MIIHTETTLVLTDLREEMEMKTFWKVKRQIDNGAPLRENPWQTVEEKIVKAFGPVDAAEKAFPEYKWSFCIKGFSGFILSSNNGGECLIASEVFPEES